MSKNGISIEVLHGSAIDAALEPLAALRIRVFREYPYLYEGTFEYESRYLRGYAASAESTVVLVRDGDRVIGASTAMPLLQHSDAVAPPLAAAGFEPSQVYYFGESVLLRDHRGQGLGHRFFDERERAARRFGYRVAAFCAVARPADHPKKPMDYVPHDAFWHKRGYVKRPDIVTKFSWRDIGDAEQSEKPMEFWVRELS